MGIETQANRPDSVELETSFELGYIPAWSYSTLKVFEQCSYRSFINKVKRVPEPSSPAADRGTQIHQECEDFVNGKLEKQTKNMEKYKADFDNLRLLYEQGRVELEGEWGFTRDWAPTTWMGKGVWARIKLDAKVMEDETSAIVIDYKTGKKYGNEIGHGEQGLLYAIATFLRNPELQHVTVQFWYLDQPREQMTEKKYTRNQVMNFLPAWHSRAVKMTTALEFDPTPSKEACRWCPYKKGEFPECKWGVE